MALKAPVPEKMAAYHSKYPAMTPAADVDAASVEARFRAGKTVPLAEALGYAAQLPSEQRANDKSTGCYCMKSGGACGCPVGLPVGLSFNILCCGDSCLYTPLLSPCLGPILYVGVCAFCFNANAGAHSLGIQRLPKPPGAWVSGDRGEARLATVDGERQTLAHYAYPYCVDQPCVVCYRLF